MTTLTYTGELVIEKCWCGISHAIPRELAAQAKRTGKAVYCPLGHQWVMRRTVEHDLAERDRELKYVRGRLEEERRDHGHTQAQLRGTKGALTRTRKRIAAGVCPCCHRTFQQLGRHMTNKHPDYATEEASRA